MERRGMPAWPPGDSEMTGRLSAQDWAANPLGPMAAWPPELHTAAAFVLENRFPAALVWGPDLVTIYNDAFRPILGGKGDVFGHSFAEIWREAWGEIGPMVERAFAGRSTFIEDFRLVTDRTGEPEEAFFTFSYSPVRGQDGTVLGMIDTVVETTAAVRSRRDLLASEARYRSLFERMGQGYCELELMRDASGRAVDQRYLAFNPAFERLFGVAVADAVGRTANAVFPGLEPWWHEAFDRIAAEGRAERIEHRVAALGRWFEVFAYPTGRDRLTVLYEDVTERRRAEDALRASEERQAFLLRLSDALRPLADAAEIQATTTRMLGAHLDLDRAMYGEVEGEPGSETGTIRGQYVRPARGGEPSAVPFPDRFTFGPFGKATMAGRYRGDLLVVADIDAAPGFEPAERAAWAAAGVKAAVVAPLVKAGRLVAEFGVHSATPRAWTEAETSLVRDVAERTWAAAERARVEGALRESEKRYRGLFETMDEGYLVSDVIFDEDGRAVDIAYVEANPAAIRMVGVDLRGRRLREVSADYEAYWYEIWGRVARTGQSERMERYASPEGIWYAFYVFKPEPEAPGSARVAVLFSDATKRKRAEAALRSSEERFRQFAAASSGALWVRDAATLDMEYVSPAISAVYGIAPDAFLGSVSIWAAALLPEDREAALANLERARAGEAVVHEFRIQRPGDGRFRWIRNTDFPLYDDQGQVQRIGGIAEDVTEARLAVEHTAVLLAELQHRVRNIMAVVRAIAARTGERAESVPEYADAMAGRLLTLARVQALLTQAANAGVGIAGIVRDELAAQAPQADQFALDGPDLILAPKTAEVLTLAVHEMTTNALKYGALATPHGRVAVRWATFERHAAPWLGFDWIEEGAPGPAASAPRRRGFGTELIEGRIPYELGGRGRLAVGAGGARCRLEFPLRDGDSILETDAPQRATVFGGALDMTGEADLHGHSVLVIEDDFYLASDAARALRGAGAEVLGPCPTEEAARAALEVQRPSAAVVDINLGRGPSFKLAEALKDRGIPFVFTTGYDAEVIPAEFGAIERLQKPVQLRRIVAAVATLVSRPD